eukprot:g26744.t1
MSTSTELFQLDDAVVVNEYVDALFGELKSFLQTKNPGHCQRIDYLPRDVMNRLGQRLADDPDLQSAKVVCRVVTDKPEHPDHETWETSGSGAVAFREDATYGRIKVFCALFPAGIRLAEEDSLNIATFKTDDAVSFNVRKCLDTHVRAKVNMLPEEERRILDAILKEETVRQLDVRLKLRYVLSVLGQKEASNQPVNWETAGAYLYELKMIPDFKLESENLPVQLTRNQMCAAILSDGDKSLTQNLDRLVTEKGLDDEERRRDLAVFLSDKDTMQPDQWLPDICHDDTAREKLSFDEWHFSEPTTGVSIELSPLQNPNTSKVAKGLIYQNGALVNDGKKPIQIRWTVKPAGTKDVGGYRIYVVRNTEEEGEVDVIMPQALSGKRKSFMVPIADNNLDDDEKCVVRIRIQALNKNGVPLQDASDESEEFWIEHGEEITPPPPDRGKRLRHLKEVSFRATHKTGKTYDVRSRGWDAKRDYIYALRLTNNDRGDLALNPLLRDLEREILLNPNNLGVYEANIVGKRTAQLSDFHEIELPDSVNTMANDFFEARSTFLTAIREQEDGTGIVEIADLHTIMDESLIYIQKYVELLKKVAEKVGNATGPGQINNILHDYAAVMRIDTVLMRIGPTESPMQVLLLSPTHPLRILWLYQYETFVDYWIQKMTGHKPDEIQRLISEDSIDKLINLNIPNAISWEQGQTFINTDNLDLFWSVLPNGNVKDLRTAVNTARHAVGASGQEVVVSTVTPMQIADKIERYLCHHPYVRSLKVNVINPGDGALLLEAIKSLLGKPLYETLNFDVKFFAPTDTRHELVGDAFDDFMTQRRPEEWTYGRSLSETEERLLQPNENPLFPKLVYAKHTISELLNDDDNRFESHLTFLIDYFGTSITTRPHTELTGSSSLHNLLAEYVTDYSAGAETATWSRLIAPNECPDLASDGNTKRLFQSHDELSHLSACFFDWANSLEKYTTVQLELTDAGERHHLRLLRQVHLISDWVFTIDRNFGIEYYDDPKRPAGGESKGYLIDYTPEFLDAVAHRLIISTYHQQEIESILRHGFANLLATGDGDEPVIASHTIGRILQILKSVSGKLALKLINNPSQAQEVIGLALTRLSLERDDRLRGRILIPVDAHINLFYQNKKELENSELTLKRNDLMLVELAGSKMIIDLIESETTKALIWELDRIGVPSIILDYQGEYAYGEFADAVEPQMFDVMDGLPVNPFELPFDPIANRKRPPIEMIFRLADTLNTVFSGSGDIQLGILREAIEACYIQAGIDFHDPTTWELEPPTLEMLERVLDHMAQDHGTQVRNLQIRLQPLFKSGIFKQQNPGFNFEQLFQQTSVILMTSGIKDLMLAASRFILEKVYSTMLMKGVTKQLRVMVVIDEAHKLCGDETIISLVKEARKYGLGLILSSQETRDFHGSVFANTGTLIALGLEDADATVMAKHLGLTDKKQQTGAKDLILSQSSGQALVRSQHFLPYAQIQILSFEDRVEVAGPTPKRTPRTIAASPSSGHPSHTPATFHGYKLVQSLDMAGMSEAYIAEKVDDGTRVFLKRVRTHSADKSALEREVRIYEKLLRLQPQYVASVLDYVRDDDYVAIVTECADGGDLQTFIAGQAAHRGLSPSDAKPIAVNLAMALKELHDSEVVHRDLKPRNVLCFGGVWKIGDFGIAKNLGRLGTLKTFQQHGTRGYAAPEQFQGVVAHPSADIYSLGKIIVFLLTGQTDVDFVPYTQWTELAKKCIAPSPDVRPTVEDVISILEGIPT